MIFETNVSKINLNPSKKGTTIKNNLERCMC